MTIRLSACLLECVVAESEVMWVVGIHVWMWVVGMHV